MVEGNVTAKAATANHDLTPADCVLPNRVDAGPVVVADEIVNGSMGLTDKVRHRHSFEYMYYPYMSNMIRTRYCRSPTGGTENNDNDAQALAPKATITMLEIGLGCAKEGGMLQGTPGGSALAWRHLFGDTHKLEIACHGV